MVEVSTPISKAQDKSELNMLLNSQAKFVDKDKFTPNSKGSNQSNANNGQANFEMRGSGNVLNSHGFHKKSTITKRRTDDYIKMNY